MILLYFCLQYCISDKRSNISNIQFAITQTGKCWYPVKQKKTSMWFYLLPKSFSSLLTISFMSKYLVKCLWIWTRGNYLYTHDLVFVQSIVYNSISCTDRSLNFYQLNWMTWLNSTLIPDMSAPKTTWQKTNRKRRV